MKRITLLITLVGIGFMAGCAGDRNAANASSASLEVFIRNNTAKDVPCPEDKVSVKDLGIANVQHNYEASGCGVIARYTFAAAIPRATPSCTCTKHCPDPNHPGGGTTCCEWDCK